MPRNPRWLEAARAANAPKSDWLARAIARAGALPLAEAERAIAEGRVKLDGKVAKTPFAPVTETSQVSVDGTPVSLAAKTRVLAFHKPRGLVTAGKDPERIGTVFEALQRALPPELQGFGWHAVGRLDRDTTGLLLFTNDERFVAHATSPDTHLTKRYVAKVHGEVTDDKLAKLRAGIELEDGPTRPAQAERIADGVVALTLTEGRNRQVKRMLGAVGLPVHALHRECIGDLVVHGEAGEFVELDSKQILRTLRFDTDARAAVATPPETP